MHSLHEAGQIALGARKQSRGKTNPHVGSDFEDFLAEEGWLPVTNVSRLEIEQLCEQVVGYFEGDVAKAALWFRLPNPLLGDLSPRDMIRYGRYAKLQQFVMGEPHAANASTWMYSPVRSGAGTAERCGARRQCGGGGVGQGWLPSACCDPGDDYSY